MADKGVGVGECGQHGEYYLDAKDSPCPSCEEGEEVMVTLEEAMAAIEMVLAASEDENGQHRSDEETCERIEWDQLEDLLANYAEGE